MKNRQKIIDVISNHFKAPFNELLLDEIRHSIRLKTISNAEIKIGKTKFGGVPHLPESIKWPINKKSNTPYTFIGQINLEEISHIEEENILPKKGILYFFYDREEWDDGCVIYSEEIKDLKSVNVPEELMKERKTFFQKIFNLKGTKLLLTECGVEIFGEYGLVSQNSLEFEKLIRENSIEEIPNVVMEEAVYEDELLFDEGDSAMNPNHHLLGIYNGIHHEYCQLELINEWTKINKLSLELIEKALKWKLLLQIDSDKNLDLMIADSGKLYFFIHEDDLAKKDFNKVKIIGDTY